MITEEDKRTLLYFHEEKGDITGCFVWDDKKEEIEAEYPELIKALRDFTAAERVLDLVVKAVCEEEV